MGSLSWWNGPYCLPTSCEFLPYSQNPSFVMIGNFPSFPCHLEYLATRFQSMRCEWISMLRDFPQVSSWIALTQRCFSLVILYKIKFPPIIISKSHLFFALITIFNLLVSLCLSDSKFHEHNEHSCPIYCYILSPITVGD